MWFIKSLGTKPFHIFHLENRELDNILWVILEYT